MPKNDRLIYNFSCDFLEKISFLLFCKSCILELIDFLNGNVNNNNNNHLC